MNSAMDEAERKAWQNSMDRNNLGLNNLGAATTARDAVTASMQQHRSPYQIGDDLHRLSEKFAGPSEEHRLLREASMCIATLLNDVRHAEHRAETSEHNAAMFNAKIKLAKLALDAVHVS